MGVLLLLSLLMMRCVTAAFPAKVLCGWQYRYIIMVLMHEMAAVPVISL